MRLLAWVLATVVPLVLTGCGGDDDSRPTTAAVTVGAGTGDIVVHGVVSRGDEPVADAQLWITLVDDGEEAEVGDTVETWDSQTVHTDAEGRFALEVDPDELTGQFYGGDFLNYEVTLSVDERTAWWASTVSRVGDVWRSDEEARAADPAVRMDFDLAAPTIPLTDSFGERETSELPLMEDAPTGAVPE